MAKKDKDDVTLPTEKSKEEEVKEKETTEKAEEETRKEEPKEEPKEEEPKEEEPKETKNVDPPEEDIKELPENEPEPEPTLADPPVEENLESKRPILQERLKLFQSNDIATLEKKYEMWTTEMRFLDDESDAYIAERHLEDGGNGMLYLAIFYVD